MKALLKLIFILLIGSVFASPKAFSQELSDWKQSDLENFHVVSNAPDEQTKEIVSKIEDFRRSFFNIFRREPLKSPVPTRILIFKSNDDLAEISSARKSVNGSLKNYFQEGHDANYIIVSANRRADFREVYHHYFHYLLSNHIGKSKIPAWFNEGLAQIYEDFQTNGAAKASLISFEDKYEMLRQNKLLPSEIFFSTDYYALNQQPKHGGGVFYAQSLALVNYLIEHGGTEKFTRFISALSTENSFSESFVKSFQFDVRTAEKNLKAFIERQSPALNLTAQNQVSGEYRLKFSPLSRAETESYLGDFLYQANRLDEAELHLLKSLSLDGLAAFPKSTLGLVKLRQHKADEAFRDLDKSLECKDRNYLTFYRYAYALSRQEMTEYGFVSYYDAGTAEKIRRLLSRSIELNSDFAESYNLYAFVSFVRNEELDRAHDYITKALNSAPGNDWYVLRQAELDMRKENFTRARKNAADIYRNAPGEGLRLYAQNTIQRIDSTEYQLLQSRRLEKLPYSDAISEKPFTDEEIARLRAKAMRESLNAALRQPAPDEKRIFGNILEIKCRQNQVDFMVKTESQIIKLYAESFEILKLMTFNSAFAKSEIGCGGANVENVVIIYKKSKSSDSGTSGEIVSVEFVPKEFTFSTNN